MVNVEKLRDTMENKGITVKMLAKELNLNESTIYRKLKRNGEDFSIEEANKIVMLLKITGEEAMAIFFTEQVA